MQGPWVSVIIQLAAIHLEYTEHVMVIIHMERDKGTRYRAVPLVGPISTYTYVYMHAALDPVNLARGYLTF